CRRRALSLTRVHPRHSTSLRRLETTSTKVLTCLNWDAKLALKRTRFQTLLQSALNTLPCSRLLCPSYLMCQPGRWNFCRRNSRKRRDGSMGPSFLTRCCREKLRTYGNGPNPSRMQDLSNRPDVKLKETESPTQPSHFDSAGTRCGSCRRA